MSSGVLIVELRRVTGGRATTLLASAHPRLVQAVREAWARLIYNEPAEGESTGAGGVEDAHEQ